MKSSTLSLLLLCLAAPLARAITVTESADFPQLNDAANIGSFTYTLDVGLNTISGTATSFTDQQDNFRVVVPAGKRISQVTKTNTAAQPVSVGCDFNLETLTGAGTATFPGIPTNGGTPYPLGAGEYRARAYADAFSNAWSFAITVVDAPELAAYWNFNTLPVNGVVVDSRAGLPARVLGGAAIGAGGTGKSASASDRSVRFGTAQQRLQVTGTTEAAYLTSMAAQDKMSVVFWVKQNHRESTAFHFDAPVMSPADNRNFSVHAPWSDQTIYFDTAGCCDSSRRLSIGTSGVTWTDWQHFAFVKDGTAKRIYRNGSLLASGTGAITIARAMTELFIGNNKLLTTPVDGDIDEFAVYTGALSALDVTQLQSSPPSSVAATVPVDSDGDGLLDKWELRFAVNLTTFTSATADADSDGLSNAAELAYGTNPTVANTMIVTTTALTGAGSLPQLLTDAAAAPGPDVITFSPTVFNGEAADVITLTAELGINDADGVAIDASGIAAGVTIDGGAGTNRIFNIGGAGNLTLNNLTLTGGGGAGATDSGGAIVSSGTLTATNCAFSGNSTAGVAGAIMVFSGNLTFTGCTFSGNSSSNPSGGGAIWIQGGATQMTATQCTFSGNSATTDGEGGAIEILEGTCALTQCTVSNNTATSSGGGIYMQSPATLILSRTIIAGNTGTGGPDIHKHSGTVTTSGFNLIGKNDSVATEFPAGLPNAGNDFAGTSAAPVLAKLGPLANNGGLTRTMLPLPGSPARDRISTSTLTTDQRGVPRRQWGRVDIGAAEAALQADCAWEVREVWNSNIATLVQSHATADALLADPAALELLSTAGVINFRDPATNPGDIGFFGSETAYPADNRTAQGLVDGNDNDFALLARTYITITTEDDYTFGFSSDDGARLRLFAATGGGNPSFISSTRLNTNNPADPAHSGNTLTFDAPTGNADTLGVVHLLPGTYGVEFLSWERAFGAQCEVFLARGARTAVDGNFRLLGETGAAQTFTVGTLSAAAWTVTTIYNGANSYETALDQVIRSWCGETIPNTTTTNTVPTINYADPQNGGGGHGFTQVPFPGDTAADDNFFAVGARATITIPASGDYTFNVLGDDGVRFRILNTRGWTVSGGAGATPLVDGFAAPGCCEDAYGQVFLASGTYQIEVIFNEIGGGAYLGVWVAPGRRTAYDPVRFSLVGGTPGNVAAAIPLARAPGLTRPVNDDFASALTLTGTTATAGSCNAGATMETGEPGSLGRTKSVWWTWTAPASGSVRVDTNGSSFDTVLAVLTGSAVGSLTQVALNDDGGDGPNSQLTFTAVAGTVYRLQVSAFGSSEGTIRLTLASLPTPPANDAFASATALGTAGSLTTIGTTLGSTRESGEPDHFPSTGLGSGSVWLTWSPPISGTYIVDTIGSRFDTALGIYTGTAVNALTVVATGADVPGPGNSLGNSRAVIRATSGTTYRIAIDGWTTGEYGSYFLTIVPGLSELPDLTVLEDSAAVGPIAFTVGDPARQSTVPVVTATSNNQTFLPNASLTITGTDCTNRTLTLPALAADAHGTATITVSTTVDGVAVTETFLYTVLSVNDAPSFTSTGRNLILPASAGAQTTANWATAISAGPANESAQTLSFTVTTDNPGLFTAPPAVDAAGTLTFTPNPAASGNANVTVVLQDSGGMANGGVDSSAPYYFRITTTGPATGTSVFITANGSGTGTATIAQTFDGVGTASIPWVDNSTVPGWYAQINNGATASGTFQPSSGTTALSGLINCGAASGATADRALGSKATGTGNFANISYALVMRNTGPLPVRLTNLQYVAELWRSGAVANMAETVTTFYAVSDLPLSSIVSGASSAPAVAGPGFTTLPAGANTTVSSTTVNTALDGNAALNRSSVNFTPAAATGPLVLPGQYITIKWTDANEAAGADGHQAIDNVSLTFTEEPCAISAIVGDVVRRPGANPDGSADTVDFKLNVNGLGSLAASGWQITAPGGFAQTGTYGASLQFTGVTLANFTPALVLSIQDTTGPCATTATVLLPGILGRVDLGGIPAYLQAGSLPSIFRQTGLEELTMDPGTATVTSEAVALTPGTEKCLTFTVRVDDTSTGSGFEAPDRLLVEVLATTPAGTEIEVLTHDYDLNGDGVINGGPGPLTDEFNFERKVDAVKWTSTFLLVGTIPANATSFQLRITGTINAQATPPFTEVYRFQTALLTECTDPDGDGTHSGWEWAHGTDPNNAASVFGLTGTTQDATTATLTVPGLSARTYQLLSSTNLLTWTRENTAPPGTNAPLNLTGPATAPRTFRRVLVAPVQTVIP